MGNLGNAVVEIINRRIEIGKMVNLATKDAVENIKSAFKENGILGKWDAEKLTDSNIKINLMECKTNPVAVAGLLHEKGIVMTATQDDINKIVEELVVSEINDYMFLK